VIPAQAYRELRAAFDQGQADVVLGQAQMVLDQIEDDPAQQELVPAVLLLAGAALAGTERYPDALAYLARGRELAGDGPMLVREIGTGESFWLIELDLLLLTGHYREAWALVEPLSEPGRAIESRLAATRAYVALATTYRDFDRAYQLLNTAAGLADQLRSRPQQVAVDGDRAVVLARSGRLHEAVTFADAVLPLLARPGPGPRLAWTMAQAVTVATTVARAAAEQGDAMTAERLLASLSAVAANGGSGRRFDAGQFALARGTVWRDTGHVAEAEEPITSARHTFQSLGCAPAAAQAQLEEARLARLRGYGASARPLFDRARHEFAALGLSREVAAIDLDLQSLPDDVSGS
jgi:hypothetical protein